MGCQVVYVDYDPVVGHARALLAGPGVVAIEGDLRDPDTILGHPALAEVFCPGEPIGLIMAAVMHFVDAPAAASLTRAYTRWLPPGSYLALSVGSADEQAERSLAGEYTAAAVHNHSRSQVAGFFDGLEIADPPGLTDARSWRPGIERRAPESRQGVRILAGVARKPG